jgi:hypothetical protein
VGAPARGGADLIPGWLGPADLWTSPELDSPSPRPFPRGAWRDQGGAPPGVSAGFVLLPFPAGTPDPGLSPPWSLYVLVRAIRGQRGQGGQSMTVSPPDGVPGLARR